VSGLVKKNWLKKKTSWNLFESQSRSHRRGGDVPAWNWGGQGVQVKKKGVVTGEDMRVEPGGGRLRSIGGGGAYKGGQEP